MKTESNSEVGSGEPLGAASCYAKVISLRNHSSIVNLEGFMKVEKLDENGNSWDKVRAIKIHYMNGETTRIIYGKEDRSCEHIAAMRDADYNDIAKLLA